MTIEWLQPPVSGHLAAWQIIIETTGGIIAAEKPICGEKPLVAGEFRNHLTMTAMAFRHSPWRETPWTYAKASPTRRLRRYRCGRYRPREERF